jgi:hypothetical protein
MLMSPRFFARLNLSSVKCGASVFERGVTGYDFVNGIHGDWMTIALGWTEKKIDDFQKVPSYWHILDHLKETLFSNLIPNYLIDKLIIIGIH